jgi:methyltransferase (TIGR00027 family)
MVVRTRLIDDLVIRSIAEGCDCVLSLAAGLDSRPYRLKLPPNLQWIEADLPQIILAKEMALAKDLPGCELRRVALDLTDDGACERLLTTVARVAQRVLVLSEGVLLYLDEAKVRSLANALASSSVVHFWLADIASPGVLTMMRQRLGEELASALPRFGPANGVAYFERLGWAARDVLPLLPEGIRLARVPHLLRPFGGISPPDPRCLGRESWSAVVLLERQRSARLVG